MMTTTMKEWHTTRPQPHEPLLMGWIAGGMATREATHKQQGTDDDDDDRRCTQKGPKRRRHLLGCKFFLSFLFHREQGEPLPLPCALLLLRWAYDDTSCGGILPALTDNDDNDVMSSSSSAPVLEGDRNCGSLEMQELLHDGRRVGYGYWYAQEYLWVTHADL
jgi:hypothetical protein